MQKPPLAPKPKFTESPRPGSSVTTPRKDDGPHSSPGTARRVKPALAPKPCLSKLSTTVESKLLSTKNVSEKAEIPRAIGFLNSKNGIQQGNKKPDWDYIIPICLCSHTNCQCMGNITDTVKNKTENDVKTHGGKTAESNCGRLNNGENTQSTPKKSPSDVCLHVSSNCNNVSKYKLHQQMSSLKNHMEISDLNLNSGPVRPSLSYRTWSDEMNGNPTPSFGNEIEAKEESSGSNQMSGGSHPSPTLPPDAPRKPLPVPVPRKPSRATLTRQEKVGEEREVGEMSVKEVKALSERKSRTLMSVITPVPEQGTPVSESGQSPVLPLRKPYHPPAPPPRKKPYLSTPEPALSCLAGPHHTPQDVEEVELRWDDDGVYEMECSVDEGDEEGGVKEEGRNQREVEEDNSISGHFPLNSASPRFQLETDSLSVITSATSGCPEESGGVNTIPEKPQRHSGPMAWILKKDVSEESEEEKSMEKTGQDPSSQDFTPGRRAMRELPLPPGQKISRTEVPTLVLPGDQKPRGPNLGKPRAKSFSSVDLTHNEVQKKNSFRKLLDLKLSVRMLPKLITKGGQTADSSPAEKEQCVDGEQDRLQDAPEHQGIYPFSGRKISCPHIGLEQSVDGDEYCIGMEQAVDYENMPHYEEISDYENLLEKNGVTSTQVQEVHWQNCMYSDENIYEEQEPYIPLEHQQKLSCSERDSIDEEVVLHTEGPSDDDMVMVHSSDEEDDDSYTSSKGEHEQSEDREAGAEPKKSKIHHIATEIMSSENVFVNVLKLLHIDFRDAVSKASLQSGKPVIEERQLNQILYSLPQLYELNQDLLRELEQRVAKWDENPQLADIFVKKGPYLKMYSTYIREFDKNVALLDEQCKKNPAFAGVVREFEASPRCAHLALKHYLLKPIQRIPQYQLLLTDYLKNLPPDSADYKDTQAALGIVKEVANHANDIMKQGDNFQKLIQVQCSLNGQHEIVQPGRVFLKEGILMKLSRKVMQPRKFFLFNDTLLYTTPVQSGQYKLNNMLSLAGMKVSKPSQEAYQNELNIESVERSFILSASSAAERDEWLEAISMAISDYTRKKISFISGKTPEVPEPADSGSGAPLGTKAPIWIPDLRATMCMICTCEFTLTWRRHHCRACGKVVCQACSSNKHGLEYLKNQLARVCDQCFLVLQQERKEQAFSATLSPGSKSSFAFSRKQKKIPAALKEVSANTDSSMSGYLQRSKGNKKQGKRLWFVIKDKVLYTYAASEDVAALESQPLLGFMLKEDSSQKLQFKLYHKNTLYYIFKADDVQAAQRWIESFREASVL